MATERLDSVKKAADGSRKRPTHAGADTKRDGVKQIASVAKRDAADARSASMLGRARLKRSAPAAPRGPSQQQGMNAASPAPALLRCVVVRLRASILLSRVGSDRSGELGERVLHTYLSASFEAELVVAAADVLHERVAAGDDSGGVP